jgi:hypothetical protein
MAAGKAQRCAAVELDVGERGGVAALAEVGWEQAVDEAARLVQGDEIAVRRRG